MFNVSIEEFLNSSKKRLQKEKERLNMQNNYLNDNEVNNNNGNSNAKEQSITSHSIVEKNREIVNDTNTNILLEEKENHLPPDESENKTDNDKEYLFNVDGVPKKRMLRFGEFSPNNPEIQGKTQPYLGFGEYEYRKQKLLRERQSDFQEYLAKRHNEALSKLRYKTIYENSKNDLIRFEEPSVRLQNVSPRFNKLIQTEDIMPAPYSVKPYRSGRGDFDTQSETNDYDTRRSILERSRTNQLGVKIDRVQIGTQNNIIVPGQEFVPSLDSRSNIRDNSAKARLLADLRHSYYPNDTITTFTNREKMAQLDRARARETYQEELRRQIEEKQMQALEAAERERRQEEALTRKLERQLRQLQIEREIEEAKRVQRLRQSTEEMNRLQNDYKKNITQEFSNVRYRSRVSDHRSYQSEPSTLRRSPNLTSRYSPTLPTKRHHQPFSFNVPQSSVFALPSRNYSDNYLTRKDSDPFSKYRDIDSRRRYDNFKTSMPEDPLPMPMLRSKSPVVRSLKHSSVVDSTAHGSDVLRRIEAKWQTPNTVQKSAYRKSELDSSKKKNVLTQLGAIRIQLQEEQLRLDRALQNRAALDAKGSYSHRS